MKQTNTSCRLAPLCHLPWNEPFHFLHFLRSRGKEQLEFHKTARGLGLQSQLQWVPSYLSAIAGCQWELFQAPPSLQNAPQVDVWRIFLWVVMSLCRWRSELSCNGCMKWATEEQKWGSGRMGKGFNSEWKEKGSGMNQVSSVAAPAFFLSVSDTIFLLLSLPLLVLCPMPSHLLFWALF